MAIVALDMFHGVAKLRGDRSKKNHQSCESVRFEPQRKITHKMRAIIKNSQIIFVARNIDNW
jgi:hypothetical protein